MTPLAANSASAVWSVRPPIESVGAQKNPELGGSDILPRPTQGVLLASGSQIALGRLARHRPQSFSAAKARRYLFNAKSG